MPRLTDAEYLANRELLKLDWFSHRGDALSRLLATEQWQLHRFYAPTKIFDDQQAIAHRREVTAKQPALPQQAGKLVRQIEQLLGPRPEAVPVPVVPKPSGKRTNVRGKDRVITVRGLAHPELDMQKLCRALITLAQQDPLEIAQKNKSS